MYYRKEEIFGSSKCLSHKITICTAREIDSLHHSVQMAPPRRTTESGRSTTRGSCQILTMLPRAVQRALSADPRHKHASHNLALLRQSLTDDKAQTPNKDQQGYNLQSGAGTGAETGAGGGGERKHFGGSGVNGMLNNDVGGVRSEDDSIPPGSLAQPNGLPTSTQGPVSLSPTYVYSPAKQKEGGGTAIVVSNSAESLASFKSDQLSGDSHTPAHFPASCRKNERVDFLACCPCILSSVFLLPRFALFPLVCCQH